MYRVLIKIWPLILAVMGGLILLLFTPNSLSKYLQEFSQKERSSVVIEDESQQISFKREDTLDMSSKQSEKDPQDRPMENAVKMSPSPYFENLFSGDENANADLETLESIEKPISETVTLQLENGSIVRGKKVSESEETIVVFWEGGNVSFQKSEISSISSHSDG